MNLTQRMEGGVLVVAVDAARIDAAVAIAFKDKMRALTVTAPERVILDLSSVDFLDSSGLGAVVAVMKHLGPSRRMDLAGLTAAVEKVFRLTRMDTVFRIYPDAGAALSAKADAA